MKDTCVPGESSHTPTNKFCRDKAQGRSRGGLMGGWLALVHAADHDTGSLSDWCAQGDPAVTVDCRVRDGATPQPSLAPPQPPPHPPFL